MVDSLVYGTGWLQVIWHRLVHGWCTYLCWQIDICWGLLPHLSWCWECKMSLAYRDGALVELYSIQLLLKNSRIEVHNEKKNCTYILCSLCSLWKWFVDDMLLIYVADMYLHLTYYKWQQWLMRKYWMLTKEFFCKREVLGKRSPHSFIHPPARL